MKRAPYSHTLIRLLFALGALAGLTAMVPFYQASAQTAGSFDRDRGRTMLNTLKSEIKKNYYDPAFHGIDLEARFKTAQDKIDHATSTGQIFGIVAQVLIDFEDSHLFFIPPSRANTTDY